VLSEAELRDCVGIIKDVLVEGKAGK